VTGLPTNDFSGSARRFGGLLAAGVEFGLTRNVSAKAEIAYIKFANGDITANDGTRLNIGAGIAEGKIGLNYRFNQPVAASY
jgi:opacity protein-like surface antigen